MVRLGSASCAGPPSAFFVPAQPAVPRFHGWNNGLEMLQGKWIIWSRRAIVRPVWSAGGDAPHAGNRGVRRHAARDIFGIFLTPVFYYLLQWFAERCTRQGPAAGERAGMGELADVGARSG